MRSLISLLALSLLVSGALVPKAFAINKNGEWDDSPFAAWYDRQYNADSSGTQQMGGSCCLTADGQPYPNSYTLNPDGTVTLDGIGVVIPANRVLDGSLVTLADGSTRGGPNPTGHAIVFANSSDLVHATIYCFSPGSLT